MDRNDLLRILSISVRRHAGALENLGQRRNVRLQERSEFYGLVSDRDTPDFIDALFDIRLIERRYHRAMQGCHTLL